MTHKNVVERLGLANIIILQGHSNIPIYIKLFA